MAKQASSQAIAIVHKLWVEWNKTDKTERFGQYFWNRSTHLNGQTTNPSLFYEADNLEAFTKACLFAEDVLVENS